MPRKVAAPVVKAAPVAASVSCGDIDALDDDDMAVISQVAAILVRYRLKGRR